MTNELSEHALIRRINRRLRALHYEKLCKARPGDPEDCWPYYTVDLASPNVDRHGNRKARWSESGVTGFGLDLQKLGRELGALAEREATAN